MERRIFWVEYNKPPEELVAKIGKNFAHKEKKILVKVISLHVGVDFLMHAKREGLPNHFDLPLVNHPTFCFKVLSGAFKGQELLMGTVSFLNMFSICAEESQSETI
jgi:hypothetical protein